MNSKFIISLCISTLLLTSCNEDKKMSTLNESEVFFSETLASISKDNIDDNIYYIGTEDGIVYIYNSENQQLKKISTDFDRIYKVVRDTITDKEPVYWVGTRNMGLFRCELKNNTFIMKEKHGRFYIPAAGKATKYSAYDISIQKSGIYVATSHGLLKVPKRTDENDSTLIILSPESYKEKPDSLRPVVAGNLQQYKDQYLFCSSDSGLLRVDLSSDKLEKFLIQKDIKNIVIRNDSVFSLIGNSVIVTDYNGGGEKSFNLKLPAQIYYYDETTQINYFISNNYIQLVKDADLYNSDRYKLVHTRRSIRTKCHNVMVNDLLHRQSLLVTIHSISRVGHHQDVLNSYGNVKLACTDKDYIYYLIDTKIYRQRKDEKKAYPFKDITKGTKDIRFMEVLNEELYYVDSNHEIYKASLYSNYFLNSYFLNSILSWDSHIKQDPDKKNEVTAIGKDDKNVYVGVRDGFRNLNEINKDIPLMDLSTNTPIPDPFVTKFVANGDKTLFCTLNDGIFIGNDNSFTRIAGSNSYTFIRDMGIDSTHNNKIYLLTNHELYMQDDSIFKKEKNIFGYNRLLVLDSDHIYGVPNFGITNFCDSMDYFVDIQFNPMACLVVDNRIIAGSSNGVYVFSSDLSKDVENRMVETTGTYYTIYFDEQDYFSRTNILICIILILAIIIGLWWYDRYRMSARALRTIKDGLFLRINKLKQGSRWLPKETTNEIDNLYIAVINVDEKGGKKSLEFMHALSEQIMKVTSRVAHELLPFLQKTQVKQLKANEYLGIQVSNAIAQSEKIKGSTDYFIILNLIESNEILLNIIKEEKISYDNVNRLLADRPWAIRIPSLKKVVDTIGEPSLERVTLINKAILNETTITELIEFVKKQISDLSQIPTDIFSMTLKPVVAEIKRYIHQNYDSCLSELSNAHDTKKIIEEMNKIFTANQRKFVLLQICKGECLIQDTYEKLNKLKNEKPRNLEKIEMEEMRIERNRSKFYGELQDYCKAFRDCIEESPEWQLLEELDLTSKKQSGRLLPLVLCESASFIPKSDYGQIIPGDNTSLSRARSQLKENLKNSDIILEQYSKVHPSSISSYLRELYKML